MKLPKSSKSAQRRTAWKARRDSRVRVDVETRPAFGLDFGAAAGADRTVTHAYASGAAALPEGARVGEGAGGKDGSMSSDQMQRLRDLWKAGRSESEIEKELGLSGALVTWAIWVRHLPLDRATEVVRDMAANVVSLFGRRGWEYLRERGLTPEEGRSLPAAPARRVLHPSMRWSPLLGLAMAATVTEAAAPKEKEE